jgi:hypothetical protein
MAFRSYRRDANGRFSGSGGQRKQEARLAANEKRASQRAKTVTDAAVLGGKSGTLKTMAKKAEKSAKVNAKARNVYKSKRLRNR